MYLLFHYFIWEIILLNLFNLIQCNFMSVSIEYRHVFQFTKGQRFKIINVITTNLNIYNPVVTKIDKKLDYLVVKDMYGDSYLINGDEITRLIFIT